MHSSPLTGLTLTKHGTYINQHIKAFDHTEFCGSSLKTDFSYAHNIKVTVVVIMCIIFQECCARCMYQGQGQVIAYHIYCWMQLRVAAPDTPGWYLLLAQDFW